MIMNRAFVSIDHDVESVVRIACSYPIIAATVDVPIAIAFDSAKLHFGRDFVVSVPAFEFRTHSAELRSRSSFLPFYHSSDVHDDNRDGKAFVRRP